MRLAAIAMILCIGNVTGILQPGSIRAVEAVSFIALGMSIGVLLVNLFLYRRLKSNS